MSLHGQELEGSPGERAVISISSTHDQREISASRTEKKLRPEKSRTVSLLGFSLGRAVSTGHADSYTLQGVQLLSQIRGSCKDPGKRPVLVGRCVGGVEIRAIDMRWFIHYFNYLQQ